MKEYEVRVKVLCSDLTSTEKIVMMAILLKVDWTTFTGPVSISQIVSMTNIKKRTVQRATKQLINLKWITRTSKHIEKELSTSAQTKVLVDNIKGMSSVSSSVTNDTKGVSSVSSPSVINDTSSSVINDIHTISNNINSINNNIEETEPLDKKEVDQNCIEGESEFWIYPSSIEDAVTRRRTEEYIQAHPNMTYSDKQRLLYPQLSKPMWSTNN
jgi:hypothetical protein